MLLSSKAGLTGLVSDEITESQALLGDANPSAPSFLGDIRERRVVAAVIRALQAPAGC